MRKRKNKFYALTFFDCQRIKCGVRFLTTFATEKKPISSFALKSVIRIDVWVYPLRHINTIQSLIFSKTNYEWYIILQHD